MTINSPSRAPVYQQSINKTKSDFTRLHFFYDSDSWYICEAIHLFCLLVDIYLFYALSHHRIIENRSHNKVGRKKKGALWLENLCIVGILLALARFINNQVLLFRGWSSSMLCSILLNTSIAFYFIAILPIYIFLWERQRIFYSNPTLSHLYSKLIQFLSWATLVGFVLTCTISMVLFKIDSQNSATGRVCETPRSSNASYWDARAFLIEARHQGIKVNAMAGVIACAVQVLFLALFLYPLVENKFGALRIKRSQKRSSALMNLIRRSFVLAFICIFSDGSVIIIVKQIHQDAPEAIFAPLATYDVSLMINLICIISSFKNWKRILFPWYYAWYGTCKPNKTMSAKNCTIVCVSNQRSNRFFTAFTTFVENDKLSVESTSNLK